MNDNLSSLIRQALTIAGTLAMTLGYMTAAQEGSFVETGVTVGGGIVTLISIIWSVYQNWQARHAQAVAAVTGKPVVIPVIGALKVATAVPSASGPADKVKVQAAT